MEDRKQYDVIVIGGSYSGLAAAMALGRALKTVLVIDSGKPCNAQTPHSHNFLTQDGETPAAIAAIGRQQVEQYKTVSFANGLAVSGSKKESGFEIETASGETFCARKLIFATGIKDMLPDIDGLQACWGISALHCPYCHGYEIRNEATGILGNGSDGFELSQLISNWTGDLKLFTNGPSALTKEQTSSLQKHQITIIEKEVERLEHDKGFLKSIVFKDGTQQALTALYTRNPFVQHCPIAQSLGCALTDEGYLKVDGAMKTTVHGVFACGDNTGRIRTVANAVSTGTKAGMMVSKKMIIEEF